MPLTMKRTEEFQDHIPTASPDVSTAKPKPPLTAQDIEDMKKPKVLIVGAGLGGVTLGILLERAGIPYRIFERAAQVKPLGSAMGIGPNILPCLKQLGLFEEFLKIVKPMVLAHSYNNDMKVTQITDWSVRDELGGDKSFVVARPMLYDLLLRQIPPHKILMGKRVTSLLQNKHGVMIRCSDNRNYHGDILVGADGAYSGVRQSLYKQLNDKKKLKKSDSGTLPFKCICLVGQTDVVDAAEFPEINSTDSHFAGISEFPYSRVAFTTRENTICWTVVQHLDKDTAKDNDAFRNSEWGPEAAEAMCKKVGHLRIPGGNGNLTLKDLFDRTPKNLISKVMLEEKVFDTWYGGRTVLLGDACHKMHPAAGQGAVNAMQDAITLANVIASLPSKETLQGALVRYTMMNMPAWLNKIAMAKLIQVRPQVNFLPRAEDKGTVKAKYQPSLHRKVTFAVPPAAAPTAVEAPTVV